MGYEGRLKECLAGVKFNGFPGESPGEVSAQEVEIAVVFVGVFGGGGAGEIDDLEEQAFLAMKAKPRSR